MIPRTSLGAYRPTFAAGEQLKYFHVPIRQPSRPPVLSLEPPAVKGRCLGLLAMLRRPTTVEGLRSWRAYSRVPGPSKRPSLHSGA